MRVSVVLLPGSNCDHDMVYAFKKVPGAAVEIVWHRDRDLKNPDVVAVPGGFSYGDYLRCGALAKLSPVMEEVKKFADKGGPVIGVCNGFQILCEAGLLPGVLLQNIKRKFLSQFVDLKVESNSTPFTRNFGEGEMLSCPIAHFEGNYYADDETIRTLEEEGRVIFRYSSDCGGVDADDICSNPNGSKNSIAGICSKGRNVVGMMPHPERAVDQIIGGKQGLKIFESVLG